VPGVDLLHPLVAAALEGTNVPFEVVACDPTLADTAAFCAAYGYGLRESANTILVIGKAAEPVYAACVVLATHRLDVNRAVKSLLGTRKASFAPPELTTELTGMEIGGVTAVGLPPSLRRFVDGDVMAADRVVLGGGNRTSKLVGPPQLLSVVAGVQVVDGLAQVVEAAP
jgi:prolyl-tRNA editing enzyme YbaK/EbsC (Cys-tRNA(Pro) deacylase)